MTTQLKVKVMSLAAEAKIIRKEENKAKANVRWCKANGKEAERAQAARKRDSLAGHRRDVVRYEARHSLLAYGFLRGTPYLRIEAKYHVPPNWTKVQEIAERFGGGKYDNEFKVWRETPLPIVA